MSFDWKSLVRTAAPILGTAISGGNPLGGVALKAVSNALLGKPSGTEKEIEETLKNADPVTLVTLKQADLDFEKHMASIGLDAKKLIIEDKNSARERQSKAKDKMPNYLFFVLSSMVIGIVCLISFATLTQLQLNFLLPISGAIMTAWIGSCQYFNGTTLGSSKKNDWKKL